MDAPPIYPSYLRVNYTAGRQGRPISAIVLHVTGGPSASSAIGWFSNPVSEVSSHYVIDRNGDIYATVREQDTAWVNGVVDEPNYDIPVIDYWMRMHINPNLETLGIEVAGYSSTQPSGQPPSLVGYTEAQFWALSYLLPVLSDRYAVPLDPDWTFGHKELDSVNRPNCPGLSAAEWSRIYGMDAVEPNSDDALLEARWQANRGMVGEQIAACLLHRDWIEDGTTKVLRCERGWVGLSDEIEARLTDDCDTLLTQGGYLQRL